MPPTAPSLPVVVTVGFSGSRRLPTAGPMDDERIVAHLTQRLGEAIKRLGLAETEVCAVSQIAVGGDTAFTEACARSGIRQRVFLPQTVEEYLNAADAKTQEADFDDRQRQRARDLLSSRRIVQEHVVSHAADREVRFEEANLEILRVSDFCVCLLAEGSGKGRAGSRHFLRKALAQGKPTLIVRVSRGPRGLLFRERWCGFPVPDADWGKPRLPQEIVPNRARGRLPAHASPIDLDGYLTYLKGLGDTGANGLRRIFGASALAVVGAHFLATACAARASVVAHGSPLFRGLLVAEICLLFLGFATHFGLHRSHSVKRWARLRLADAVARSVGALGGRHVQLDYLFRLPMPPDFRSLLRTLNVLHLEATRDSTEPWETSRNRYLHSRIEEQVGYFNRKFAGSKRGRWWSSRIFQIATALALASTSAKLAFVHSMSEDALGWLGVAAILFPVVGVAAVSLAASYDVEAGSEIYQEMVEFLEEAKRDVEGAHSEREFVRLALEIERRLLGETLAWSSRRSFTGVN